MFLSHLECTECRAVHAARALSTVCRDCGATLQACYDLATLRRQVDRDAVVARGGSMWRYRELLPAAAGDEIVTLGEGGTPLLPLPRLAKELGVGRLFVKDESLNPTASFKARGMSAAVTMAKALGARALAAPSAGNAGGALAAYGARAGLPVHLAMPKDVPLANRIEAEVCGAAVTLIDGTIADCGRWLRERVAQEGWFDLSTLKEPYRVEGKKTMGYEIWQQLGLTLPDVILYPTGGGTGLVGMWKAFHELRELGWLDQDRPLPRMIAVQAAGCAPVVNAFAAGASRTEAVAAPHTVASGLRVPSPFADRWMLRVLRESGGQAIAVSDAELLAGTRQAAHAEGMFFAPEAGALVPALVRLRELGKASPETTVVLFNTGAGLKYLECFGG